MGIQVPSVLILGDRLASVPESDLRALPHALVVVAASGLARVVSEKADCLFVELPEAADEEQRLGVLRAAGIHAVTLLAQQRVELDLEQSALDLHELSSVGIALMRVRDLDVLLPMILREARRITGSDAGSLYLAEIDSSGAEFLHFRLMQNDSLPQVEQPSFRLPVDSSSIAGHAALQTKPLVIDDAYQIPEDAPYSFNPSFDREYGYRAKSMLMVPLRDPRGDLVGVVQLVNPKRDPFATLIDERSVEVHVRPYVTHDVRIVQSLAGQAAICIENSRLHGAIERLFEGLVTAAVTAIEQRDPTTSGHSFRVAQLTCDLAEVVDGLQAGVYAEERFPYQRMRQLRFAALLHDFGKVGVREEVLVKANKLPPLLDRGVGDRFRLIRAVVQGQFEKQRAEYLLEHGVDEYDAFVKRLDAEFELERQRVDRFEQAIREANIPRVLAEEQAGILDEIAATGYRDSFGEEIPYLTPEELHFVKIPRGSLDPDERKEIESHVSFTHQFLRQIPWTEDLKQVSEIAYTHHERMNGSGYPRGLRGESIPLEARIMMVADIFDALTASDRPYKKSVPVERALDILRMEVDDGKLEGKVVDLMIESGVYRRILE